MPRFLVLILLLLVFALGCHKPKSRVLGKPFETSLRTILAVQAGDTPPKVALSGVLVEKCPVAGCWFRLRDDTGIIKVDTKNANFVVVDIPLQTKLTVSGKVAAEGQEVILDASGLKY